MLRRLPLILATLSSLAPAAHLAAKMPKLEFKVTRQWLAHPKPVASLLPVKGDFPRSIPLVVDRGTMPAREAFPLGVGIPLREGHVKDPSGLAIEGKRQGRVPAVFEARARWRDGSIRWAWADFQGEVDDRYELVFGPASAAKLAGNQVQADAKRIVVENDRLEVAWDRAAAFPVSLRLAEGARPVMAGDGRGVYLVDNRGRRAAMAGPAAELDWKVETDHALRTVVRVEGWYVTDDGQRVARAVLRYHVYRQMPWIRIEHTFVVTEDNEQVWYRQVGLHVPAPPGEERKVFFGLASGKPAAAADFRREAYVFQGSYPVYDRRASECVVGCDDRVVARCGAASGWADVQGGAGGLVVGVKDFAPQFPKEICVGRAALEVKLWSDRGGMLLDYKPETLAKDWWGDWLARSPFSSAAKETKGHWPTPEEIRRMNPSPVGTARTHELYLVWYEGASRPERAALLGSLVEHPTVVQPVPTWTVHADPRILSPTVARSEVAPRYRPLEKLYSGWLEGNRAPLEAFPMTGWYEWGKNPDLRYEKTPEGTVYAQWYRLGNTNYYYYNRNLFTTWLRTGERKFLDVAQRTNRFLADTRYAHWSGGRDKKVAGFETSGGVYPIYWAGGRLTSDGASQEPLTAMVLDYYMCDQRRYRDLAGLVRRALLENFKPNYSGTGDVRMRAMMAILDLEPDEKLAEMIRSFMQAMLDPESPIGLNAGYWKGESDALYKVHRKCFNTIEYQNRTQEEWLTPCIVKMGLACMGRYAKAFEQPFSYQNYSPAIAARLYQITGDPDWLAWLEYQVEAAVEIARQYEAVPAGERGAAYFTGRAVKPGARSGSGRYAFTVSFLEDPRAKGELCFGGDKGPILVSFPFGVNVLQGAGGASKPWPE